MVDETALGYRADAPATCIVIGAGPAGLGTAAMLGRLGVPAIVLERGPALAAKWRAGYDRLAINTSSWFSYLPRRRFPRACGRWLGRDDLVAYYDAYAAEFRLDIRTNVEVLRIDRGGDGWCLTTTDGELWAKTAVVATAKDHTPVIPDWPGLERYTGRLLHASEYHNAEPYAGRRAVVVGAGNSALDIAMDLLEGGAATVDMAIRTPPNLARREVAGLPSDLFTVLSRRLPDRTIDSAARFVQRIAFGDLAAEGMPVPDEGPATRIRKRGQIPTVAYGSFGRALKAGDIRIVAAVESFDEAGPALADGRRLEADVVVAATGYRSGLGPLVGHLGILGDRDRPLAHGRHTHPAAPGLRFVGFTDALSGNFREMRIDAQRTAKAIAAELRS